MLKLDGRRRGFLLFAALVGGLWLGSAWGQKPPPVVPQRFALADLEGRLRVFARTRRL